MMNRKVDLVVFLLFLAFNVFAQRNIAELCGAWSKVYIDEITYMSDGWVVTDCFSNAHDETRKILCDDGTGYVSWEHTDDNDRFTWTVDGNNIIYKEYESCPWNDTLIYRLSYGPDYDTLKLEQKYKRKTYRRISIYLREKINLLPTDNPPAVKIKKSDSEFAYKMSVVKNQRPVVARGFFDERNMRLYVDRPMYSEICKSKGYDGIELFIVDGDRKKGKKMKSFYIAYKPDSEEISAICKTNDYDADIVADTKKSAAKAETDTIKCNCSDPMSGHLGKGEQDAHADCCKRDSIILQHLDELSQTRRNRKDVEFAYNNRTIKDQKPHVTFGYYDEKSNVLYLENLFCDFIKRAKGYDTIEIFVIGNTKETKSNISSYVVSYSPQTNEIVNVSKIKEFHYNRSYDKADRY